MKEFDCSLEELWCCCNILYSHGIAKQIRRMIQLDGNRLGLNLIHQGRDMDCSEYNQKLWSYRIKRHKEKELGRNE